MKSMTALQEQENSWMSFNHLITMIDHFKLNLGAANAYMSIQCITSYVMGEKSVGGHEICGEWVPGHGGWAQYWWRGGCHFVITMDAYFVFVFCTVKQWKHNVMLLGDNMIWLQIRLLKHSLIIIPHTLCNLIVSGIGSVFLCPPQILCCQLTMIFNISAIIRWG